MSLLRPAPPKARKEGFQRTGEVSFLLDHRFKFKILSLARNASHVGSRITDHRFLSAIAVSSGIIQLALTHPLQLLPTTNGTAPSVLLVLASLGLKMEVYIR